MSALGRGGRLSAALLLIVVLLASASSASLLGEARDTAEKAKSLLDRTGILQQLPQPPAPPSQEQAVQTAEQTRATAQATGASAQASAAAAADDAYRAVDPDAILQKAHKAVDDANEGAYRAVAVVESAFATPDIVAEDAPQSAAPAPAAPSPVTGFIAASLVAVGSAAATFFAFWLAGSSGTLTVGAGAAASRTTDLKRLLPFASPLFTRFEKDTVLGHPRREALYALILQQPGISLQALGDATGLSRTAVLHHLRLIEQQHLIGSIRKGRSRHYYENGGRFGHDQKDAYAILQNGRSKEVAEAIRANPGILQKALCQALGIQPSIAHWHVRRLVEARLVEAIHQGRTVSYFPAAGLNGLQQPVPAQLPAIAAPMTA